MEIFNFLLHFDESLASIINLFGPITYVILFLIVFAETGLVVMPFLPGDSLLFAVGTLAGGNFLNIFLVYITLLAAAIIGDTVNYWVGHHLGSRVFTKDNSRIFNKAYLEKTTEFYKKHGGKTIILARFIPIVRTFAPFVAGVGKMHYTTFLFYNISGGFLWVTSLTLAGYFFGRMPIIKENFEYAVIVIILISLLPIVIEFFKHKFALGNIKKKESKTSYQEIQKTFRKEGLND
ncbi:MAG: DedA family protein [Candidatus Levybacteria bacterium]|nr:DedA family protein [Candidatus Levybacteria bacterium]